MMRTFKPSLRCFCCRHRIAFLKECDRPISSTLNATCSNDNSNDNSNGSSQSSNSLVPSYVAATFSDRTSGNCVSKRCCFTYFSVATVLNLLPYEKWCGGTCRHFGSGRAHPSSSYENPTKSNSIRKMLRFFYKHVHPDLTANFTEEAKRINQKSLAELNAYIDKLETIETTQDSLRREFNDAPVVQRSIPFFKEFKTSRGKVIPGRVQIFNVALPTIRPGATYLEKETIATRLVRELQLSIEATPEALSNQPKPPPLFSPTNITRENMEKLWWQQTHSVMVKSALYQPEEKYQRRIIGMNKHYKRCRRQLIENALRMRRAKTRKRRLAEVEETAAKKVYEKFGADPEKVPDDVQEQITKIHIIENGFHPDLVFTDPLLSSQQRLEGLQRVCGMNLKKESDLWLLENMWKAMREHETPVPVVLGSSGTFCAKSCRGFVVIPHDFDVWEFADFLEEHLDDIRKAREEGVRVLCSGATFGMDVFSDAEGIAGTMTNSMAWEEERF